MIDILDELLLIKQLYPNVLIWIMLGSALVLFLIITKYFQKME